MGIALLACSTAWRPTTADASVEFDDLLKISETPNDPLFSSAQWAINGSEANVDLGLMKAWEVTRGEGTTIAIIDTGISDHPDLTTKVLPGYDFISNRLMANDGDGWDSDAHDPGDWVSAYESSVTFGGNCDPTDSSWHGTHVAGIAAAIGSNQVGISGVAPAANILPVRVIGKCGAVESDVLAAITWASGGHVAGVPDNPNKADVINLSLGGEHACQAATQTVIDAALSRGSVLVVAAGNSGSSVSAFSPANCNGVIRVGSIGKNGNMSSFSNYAQANDSNFVVAPGGERGGDSFGIMSTINSGKTTPSQASYAAEIGTSMASPHVAGLVALVKSANPDLSGLPLIAEVFKSVKVNSSSQCALLRCGRGQIYAANLGDLATISLPQPFIKRFESRATLEWLGFPSRMQSARVEVQTSADGKTWQTQGTHALPRVELLNLISGTEYQARFRASLGSKIGEWQQLSGKIALSTKAPAPTKIGLIPSDGALKVTWVEQLGNSGLNQIGYFVKAISRETGQANSCSTTSFTCNVTGLSNGQEYVVTVTAVTQDGLTTISEPSSATPFSVPSQPRNIATSDGLNALLVSWALPLDNGGRAITGYSATATTSSGIQKKCESDTTFCYITGISQNAITNVEVVAVNIAGLSKSSSAFETRFEPIGLLNAKFKLVQGSASKTKTKFFLSWTALPQRPMTGNFKMKLRWLCANRWQAPIWLPVSAFRTQTLTCKPSRVGYTITDGHTTQAEIFQTLR